MSSKAENIIFLHTLEVMREKFDFNFSIPVHHIVKESLLKDYREGKISQSKEDYDDEIKGIKKDDIIICTCSSLGSITNQLASEKEINLHRVDATLGTFAESKGSKILLVAAIKTAIEPSKQLFNKPENLDDHVCDESAWKSFQEGDILNYHKTIASEIDKIAQNYDIIVLAQASMDGCKSYSSFASKIVSSIDSSKAMIQDLL